MTTQIILRYIGNGSYVAGIPATDLTEADIAASGFAIDEIMAFRNGGEPLYVSTQPEADAEGKEQ
jgi:hypothetical protein